MPEAAIHVVSSAVVTVRPERRDGVVAALAALPMTEVHAAAGSRIVAILEGASRGEVGSRLAHISLLDGVVAANMVFEHVDGDGGEDAGGNGDRGRKEDGEVTP